MPPSAIATISELNVYPIKSCRGIGLQASRLTPTGLAFDRHWMVVGENGRFVTQRECAAMALIGVSLVMNGADAIGVQLSAPGVQPFTVPTPTKPASTNVVVWRDTLPANDQGDDAARWVSDYLGRPVRLVRFDAAQRRVSSSEFTGAVEALNAFSDGYAILAIGEESLADLNTRLRSSAQFAGQQPLKMNRFRPNIVLSGLPAYDEDRAYELRAPGIVLRIVKPCTRCKITTIDQESAAPLGDEPLNTLKSYRWDAKLRGVVFGQNVIVIEGVGRELKVGQAFDVVYRA